MKICKESESDKEKKDSESETWRERERACEKACEREGVKVQYERDSTPLSQFETYEN